MSEIQIKEDIKELKTLIKEAIGHLKGKKKWLDVTERQLRDWFNRLDDIGGVENLSEDEMLEQVRNRLIQQGLGECFEFTLTTMLQLHELIAEGREDDLHFNIVEYYESRVELFDEINTICSQDEMDYQSIDDVIENLEVALSKL